MRTAAEFLGYISHGYDSDGIAVLFVKQGDSAFFLGFLKRKDFGFDRQMPVDVSVDQSFDFIQLFWIEPALGLEYKA